MKKREARKLALRYAAWLLSDGRLPEVDELWEAHPELTRYEAERVQEAIADIGVGLERRAIRLEARKETV